MEDDDLDVMFAQAATELTEKALGGDGQLGANANAEGGMPDANTKPPAEATIATPAPAAAASEQILATPETPDAPAVAVVAPPVVEPLNLEGISGGLVKTPEDVTRIATEHRTMAQELAQLREAAKVDPFANEFVKSLNQMQRDGKSPDQVKAFIKIQDLGDISKLPPMQAMIEARVLRDGHKADVVQKMLERKYEITEEMDPMDREIAEVRMADDAKADYEYLQTQKKELATPKTPDAPAAAVQTIAREVIQGQVNPIKPKVQEQFKSFGEINLNGKVDKDGKPTADAVLFDLPIPNEFAAEIPALLDDFFLNQNLPVTKENLEVALEVVQLNLYKNYGVKIIQDACNQYGTILEKRIRAEYQNNAGKSGDERVRQPINAIDLSDAQMEQYVSGE